MIMITKLRFSSLHLADPLDKAFEVEQNQWVIWSVGPVGSLQTPANTIIPVPFKHYLRADYNGKPTRSHMTTSYSHKCSFAISIIDTDPLQVNFSRTPLNECQQLQCSGCDVPLTKWTQPVLDLGDSFEINAKIGQSGGQRGYAGITGS